MVFGNRKQSFYTFKLFSQAYFLFFLLVGQPKLDLEKMMAQKLDAVKGLTSGIAYLFKNNKVIIKQKYLE